MLISPFFFLHLLLLRQIAAIVCSCRHQESTGRPGLDLMQRFALSSALPHFSSWWSSSEQHLGCAHFAFGSCGQPGSSKGERWHRFGLLWPLFGDNGCCSIISVLSGSAYFCYVKTDASASGNKRNAPKLHCCNAKDPAARLSLAAAGFGPSSTPVNLLEGNIAEILIYEGYVKNSSLEDIFLALNTMQDVR